MSATSINPTELSAGGKHEQVRMWSEPISGYRGVIAIHSTRLGPALGGTRFWNYANDDEAIADALRLSRAMSYKNALADLPFGGGKSVIIGDNRTTNRESLFRAHGKFIETFQGRYITAEDIGTTPADMDLVRLETDYVAGLSDKSGDPSPVTARGVFRGIQAAAKHAWGSDDLLGKTVALQGCGKTGYHLAQELNAVGAKLVVADVDQKNLTRVVAEFGAVAIDPNEILATRADVFAPCAFGSILNERTISQLQVAIVSGSANNQLLDEHDGDLLHQRGIVYVPDYVCNAGGVMSGCRELLGWNTKQTFEKVDGIYDKVLKILQLAHEQNIPPAKMADELGRRILYPE